MDHQENIVIVGLDKLKRQVIQIISDQAIIFKQISNFNIKGIQFVNQDNFQYGLISYGYQNIRIWTINPKNSIINGNSLYLGKISHNITFIDCTIIQTVAGRYGFACDSQGYVTKVNINDKKMEGVVKVDNCKIDHIRFIKYKNNQQKILIINEKGVIKILNCINMQCEVEYSLNQRVKSLFLKSNHNSYKNYQHTQQHESQQEIPILLLQTYKKTIAQVDLATFEIKFNLRSHEQNITCIAMNSHKDYINEDKKIVTASIDNTLRIWKNIKVSQTQYILKEEYQFLITGEEITHVVVSSKNKQL